MLPEVAREAIRARLEGRAPRALVQPRGILARVAPVFVTLRVGHELRGCIGELEARHQDLIEETTDRACAAAFQDLRFLPLTSEELDRCSIEVTILGALRPVSSISELDPDRYGIEMSDPSGRRAVLLPGIEGVDTAELQLEITRQKAGIGPNDPVSIRRFAVLRVAPDGIEGSIASVWP